MDEDSTFEISLLLSSLATGANHKRRLKSLKRFKDYVSTPSPASQSSVSERGPGPHSGDGEDRDAGSKAAWKGHSFYDDDVVHLFTGRSVSDPDEGAAASGLLAACGEPSSSSSAFDVHCLKRSTADAIKLLFYLVFEAPTGDDDAETDNGLSAGARGGGVFFDTFVNLSASDLGKMSLGMHVVLSDDPKTDKVRMNKIRRRSAASRCDPF